MTDPSGAATFGRGDIDGPRYPLDPNADAGNSEFSWGAGLTPKGLESAAPNEGGRYCGTTPEEPRPQVTVARDSRI
jgi:hypothetical protein